MEKESYNIDDILSEVKKRREEQEQMLKKDSDKTKADVTDLKKSDAVKTETKSIEKKAKAAAEAKKTQIKQPKKETFNQVIVSEKDSVKAEPKKKESVSQKKETVDINVKAKTKDIKEEENSNMVDLLHLTQEEDHFSTEETKDKLKKEKFIKTKKGKIVVSIVVVLVILIAAAGAFAFYYVNNMLNSVTNGPEEKPYKATEYYDGMDFLQEDFPTINEQSAGDVYSYKEYLKYWYQNGDPVRSSHVLNILLIGEDTREETISDTSRADSAIIASINVDTGKIHLTSILRDLFVYYEVNGEGHYGKINESASMGGMNTYITTLERYYKISIDNYAVVNFASFPKIIDALGGVEVALTNAEVYEVNSHPVRYAHATLPEAQFDAEGNPAKVKLAGEQALAYCRIRKIDSDNARADRQKTVLHALFDKMKGSGTLDAVKVVNQLSQYTKTGYTKKELISIGNLALRDGWLGYKIETANVPAPENCKGGQKFSVAPGNWIWLADIPKDANELQTLIYGKSNIQLSENRPDYISMGR